MTLKEELEILRGEPIQVFDGEPMGIPCIETSDAAKLCRDPVVSVCMVAYNHEPYIRQAIESVMMQKTDFEFELVIGEDCSQDKTREICFEYQRKYPDKVRVLWWHENISKLGGNGRRNRARCRGEFIAFCEGDDYWIDPLKLQKQVDIMRRNPTVGFCFCDAKMENSDRKEETIWHSTMFSKGIMSGKRFLLYHLFGSDPALPPGREGFIMTATVMIRKNTFEKAAERFDVFGWSLCLGDKVVWYGLSAISDVYYLMDSVSVYRITSTGAMGTNMARVCRDSGLLRIYFPMQVWGLSAYALPEFAITQYAENAISVFRRAPIRAVLRFLCGVFRTRFAVLFARRSFLVMWISVAIALFDRLSCRFLALFLPRQPWRVSSRLRMLYKEFKR